MSESCTLRHLCEIWHDDEAGHEIFKKHRLQVGSAPWWPVAAKLKMSAKRYRSVNSSASTDGIYKCDIIFPRFRI